MGNSRLLQDLAAEQEANEIGSKFMQSSDVISDMSSNYGFDFSDINIHHDESAAGKASERGVDAFASGNDIFFGRGVFESNSPESRGLLAHELTHTMQQGGSESVSQSAPEGAEQGGIIDYFRKKFGKKAQPTAQPKPTKNFALDKNSDDFRTAMNDPVRVKQIAGSANVPAALTNIGIRTTSTDTGQAHIKMLEPIFGRSSDLFDSIQGYWAGQENQDFSSDAKNTTMLDTNGMGKGIRYGGGQKQNIEDLMDMFSDRILNTGNLQGYLDVMQSTVGQTNVFNGGIGGDKSKSMQLSDYITQSMMNTYAMAVSQSGTDKFESDPDKQTVKIKAGSSLMLVPVIYDRIKKGEMRIQDVPPEVIPVLQKYMLLNGRLQGMINGPQSSGFTKQQIEAAKMPQPTTTHSEARSTNKGWVPPSYQKELDDINSNGGFLSGGYDHSTATKEQSEAFFISQMKQARAVGDKDKIRFYAQQLADLRA